MQIDYLYRYSWTLPTQISEKTKKKKNIPMQINPSSSHLEEYIIILHFCRGNK